MSASALYQENYKNSRMLNLCKVQGFYTFYLYMYERLRFNPLKTNRICVIIIISIQPEGRFWQEPEPS